jgi:hypothetical protein
MSYAKPNAEVSADIRGQIDQLQIWFASRPYGFREHASPEQLQQFTDREREQDYLIGRLEMLEG